MLRMTKIMDGTKRHAVRGDAKARGVTSVSVAAAAGVSQSTVSLVMSGKSEGRVSPEVRTLVEETARRLGYQPNASAQMLRTGVLKVVALAVPNVRQPFFGEVLVAAELAAREARQSQENLQRFLAMAAHDLHNPITGILGYA